MSWRYDDSEVVSQNKNIEEAVSPRGLVELAQYAEKALERDIARGFATYSDPRTGRRWAARKDGSAATLNRTGTLRSLIKASSGPLNNRARINAEVSDATKVRRSRLTYGKKRRGKLAPVSYSMIAGALYYGRPGRKRARARRSIPMPARPFADFSRRSMKDIHKKARAALKID